MVSVVSVALMEAERSAENHLTTGSATAELYALDLQNILRLSYDNAKVTIDLRRTSDVQNIQYEGRKAFLRYDSHAKSQDRLRQCSQISLRYS